MLALAIIVVRPEITVPAFSEFASRDNGPVFSGPLFPFLFVTIACGALSGFHALIASGTTPKLIEKERQTRLIGYGGMLMESFVAIMALVAAISIDRGIYFAMNAPVAADRRHRRDRGRVGQQPGPVRRQHHARHARADGRATSARKASSPAPAAPPPWPSAWPTSCSSSSAAPR